MAEKRIICPRQRFIDASRGDLMVRDEKGRIIHLGDDAIAQAAVDAHEKGQRVYLTIDGEIVSSIHNYVERREPPAGEL